MPFPSFLIPHPASTVTAQAVPGCDGAIEASGSQVRTATRSGLVVGPRITVGGGRFFAAHAAASCLCRASLRGTAHPVGGARDRRGNSLLVRMHIFTTPSCTANPLSSGARLPGPGPHLQIPALAVCGQHGRIRGQAKRRLPGNGGVWKSQGGASQRAPAGCAVVVRRPARLK